MGVDATSPRPIGKYERLSIERFAKDLALCKSPGGHPRGLRFDAEAGDYVVRWIEKYCKHHKGEWAGQPLLLEPWQKEIVRQVFGWKRADGLRRFRTAYIEIPRKNGKSEIAGALGLVLMLADGEPGAEVYASATKKDQAKIVWSTAAAMVKQSPDLRKAIKAYRSNLSCEQLDAKFEPLGADSNTLDGLNPHGNIVDELHAHKDRGVWDVLDTAMGARRQPLTVAITTAGTYDPQSIGWEQHDYATKILEGAFEDDAFFAFIAAMDEGDDVFSLETRRKANPNLDVSIRGDYLEKQAEKAQRQPSFYNEFVRLHLNGWTAQATRWLPVEKWKACIRTPFDEATLAGRECYGGLDLASKLDLAAFVLAIPDPNEDWVDLVARFWLPENTIAEHARRGRRHYEQWAREGWITQTPGDVIDYKFIRRDVNELAKALRVREIAFDPWNATAIATDLQEDGFVLVETRQGYKTLSEPSKDLEARVVSGRVRYGSPVLRWCGLNAVVETDSAGNIKPSKESASGKIDGVVATIMALSRIVSAPASDGWESVTEIAWV